MPAFVQNGSMSSSIGILLKLVEHDNDNSVHRGKILMQSGRLTFIEKHGYPKIPSETRCGIYPFRYRTLLML